MHMGEEGQENTGGRGLNAVFFNPLLFSLFLTLFFYEYAKFTNKYESCNVILFVLTFCSQQHCIKHACRNIALFLRIWNILKLLFNLPTVVFLTRWLTKFNFLFLMLSMHKVGPSQWVYLIDLRFSFHIEIGRQ